MTQTWPSVEALHALRATIVLTQEPVTHPRAGAEARCIVCGETDEPEDGWYHIPTTDGVVLFCDRYCQWRLCYPEMAEEIGTRGRE